VVGGEDVPLGAEIALGRLRQGLVLLGWGGGRGGGMMHDESGTETHGGFLAGVVV
jgi:hypothetical protein